MITKVTDRSRACTSSNGAHFFVGEYFGLSTDVKPAGKNGDRFYEMDSKKVYMYDETNSQWLEQ